MLKLLEVFLYIAILILFLYVWLGHFQRSADSNYSGIYKVIGKLSLAFFGYGVGSVAAAAISATFFPVAAALITAFFIAALTIVLFEFSMIYFALLIKNNNFHRRKYA